MEFAKSGNDNMGSIVIGGYSGGSGTFFEGYNSTIIGGYTDENGNYITGKDLLNKGKENA